jgi:hypothetical protein
MMNAKPIDRKPTLIRDTQLIRIAIANARIDATGRFMVGNSSRKHMSRQPPGRLPQKACHDRRAFRLTSERAAARIAPKTESSETTGEGGCHESKSEHMVMAGCVFVSPIGSWSSDDWNDLGDRDG